MKLWFAQLSALIEKELWVLLRDKQAIAVLFLMPMIFIFLLSIALKDVFSEKIGAKIALQVVDLGKPQSAFTKEFVELLKGLNQFQVLDSSSASALGTSKRLRAEIIIPVGASQEFERLLSLPEISTKALKTQLVLRMDPTMDSAYRWFIRGALNIVLYEMLLSRLGKALKETPLSEKFATLNGGKNSNPALFIRDESPESSHIIPTPLQQNVPGWSLFAMFFIAVPLASSILRERQDGTVKRMLTFPVSKLTIMLGKLIPYVGVNILQFILMLCVGLYLVPLCSELQFQLGHHWYHLTLVTLVAALAATSFGVFVSCVSRSVEHASALAAGCVISMAALGGIMVPVFAMPDFMQSLARFSPLYWGHQAYLDVLLRESSFNVILPKLFILVGFSLIAVFIGKRRFQWL